MNIPVRRNRLLVVCLAGSLGFSGIALFLSGGPVALAASNPNLRPTAALPTVVLPTAIPAPTTPDKTQTGHISLTAVNAPATAWAIVEWQDSLGVWHPVETWKSWLDSGGHATWWVASDDLGGKGDYRWVVYDQSGDHTLGISPLFHLPSAAGESTAVSVSIGSSSSSLYPTATPQGGSTSGNGQSASAKILKTRESDPIASGIYIVQPGDTLFRIALRAATTVGTLQRANRWWSTTIYAGQRLTIP
jgi:hypothetical protein